MSDVLVFLLLLLSIVSIRTNIHVTDSGVVPWTEGDFVMTFYVTLNNNGNRPITLVAEMIKCCEIINEADIGCDHFKLVGSSLDIEALGTKNITLMYLNNYAYNRRGSCDIRIDILYNDKNRPEIPITQNIHFDTYLTQETYFFGLLPALNIMECESQDEDPLDSCLPVNCHMKYSGHRGFYSTSKKKCVEIPICKPENEQAYLWSINKCVNLNSTVTKKDIEEILFRIENNQIDDDKSYKTIDMIHPSQQVRCNHGHLINYTGLCECDNGWKSEDNMTDWNDFIPTTTPVQMCTIRIQDIYNGSTITELLKKMIMFPENMTTLEFIYSLILSCIAILLASCCIYYLIVVDSKEKEINHQNML